MSVNMYQPATTSIVQAQPQYAMPVNQVYESVAAPTYATMSQNVSYSSLNAPMTTMMAPTTTMAPYTMAQPTYTTMAAPQVQYAAPAVQYAQPVTTMAPSGTMTYRAGGSISAPIMAPQQIQTTTMVAAPQQMMVTQSPSYVAQQQVVMQQAAPVMAPPATLTEGIPNPAQIEVQKAAYGVALDKQLKDGTETILKETEIEKNMIKFSADKELALLQMQIEEQRNEQMAHLDEQATIRQCELRKAYVERKLQLDNQANGFIMDYQVKAVQTELAQKQYEFQITYAKAEGALEAQYAAVAANAAKGTSYAVPAQAVQ